MKKEDSKDQSSHGKSCAHKSNFEPLMCLTFKANDIETYGMAKQRNLFIGFLDAPTLCLKAVSACMMGTSRFCRFCLSFAGLLRHNFDDTSKLIFSLKKSESHAALCYFIDDHLGKKQSISQPNYGQGPPKEIAVPY
jgi:hypothetical protein